MAELKKTIQTNLDIIKGTNSSFFTGIDDLVSSTRLDPIVTGYSFLRVIDVPSWFEKDPDLKYFKDMINKNTRGFQGLSDIELTTGEHQSGFAGNAYDVITGVQKGNTEFTLTHKEYSGSIMRKLYSKYISLVRDPRTGIAMYPSLYGVEYGARNHTLSFVYMTVKPSVMDKKDDNIIEHAVFYSNCFPMSIPQSIYNFDDGNQESPTIDVSWKGHSEFGPDVEAFALKILREQIQNINSDGDGIPFLDSYNTTGAGSLQKSGFMKDIFGDKK